jgi:serine phosphatase RsbU (regulator of sigma subunit)
MKNLIIIFYIGFFFNGTCLFSKTFVYSNETIQIVNLESYLEVFEDKENKQTIHEVIHQKFEALKSRNFGHTSSGIWYKLKFDNISNKEAFIQITPEWLHHIEFYQVDGRGKIIRDKVGGTMYPYNDRDLHLNMHSFALGSNEAVYYIKVEGDHIISPHFIVGDKIQLLMNERFLNQLYFCYFGAILLLLGYNIFLTFVIKKKSYAYYSSYILFMLVGMLFIKGFINEWIDLFWVSNHSNIITSLMVIFIMLSVASFTKVNDLYPLLNKIKNLIIILSIISLLMNLWGFTRIANMIILNTVFVGGLWGLVVGLKTLKFEQPASFFVFLGYTSFILGGLIHLTCLHGVIPYNWVTHNAYLIGSGLEVFFFSFSFGVNLDSLKKEKYKAQVEIVQLAQENERFILKQNKILEKRVEERTEKLYDAYEEIQHSLNTMHKQKMLLEENSKHTLDSITSAKRIQDALLPDLDFAKKAGLDISILYKPKDILSGDFYWFGEKNGKTIIVAADCTGHGIPGAMLSITGHNLLHKIVHEQGIHHVDMILNRLHIELISLLKAKQTGTEEGMDLQIISIDKVTKETMYAGARNPIYYSDTEGNLKCIKADRFSIGGTQTVANPQFRKHKLPHQWGNIFLCSDGYQDQFGEVNQKKLMVGRLKDFLQQINTKNSTIDQIAFLKDQLSTWQGKEEQTDDILILSIKKAII